MHMDKHTAVMHIIDSIGEKIDARTASAIIKELLTRELISLSAAKLLTAAVTERPYQTLPVEYRDSVRAAVLKNMLLNLE